MPLLISVKAKMNKQTLAPDLNRKKEKSLRNTVQYLMMTL